MGSKLQRVIITGKSNFESISFEGQCFSILYLDIVGFKHLNTQILLQIRIIKYVFNYFGHLFLIFNNLWVKVLHNSSLKNINIKNSSTSAKD